MDEDIFNELEKFHLSKYEIRVYSHLLMNGPMKPTEIIKNTGIPQPRVYDILGKLQRRGLVVVRSNLNRSYEAVLPYKALKVDVDYMEKYLSGLEDYVLQNRREFQIKIPNVLFIQNSNTAERKLEEAIENAKYEIIFSLPSQKILTLISSLRKAHRSGVTLCFVLTDEMDDKIIETISTLGILRTSERTNAEMVIIDRKISFFNAKSVSLDSDYTVFLQEDELIDIMSYYYFYMNWLPAKYVFDFNSYYNEYKITTSWLACELIDNVMEHGKHLIADVSGIMENKKVSITGEVLSTTRIRGKIQAFTVLSQGREVSVGGRNGQLEKIKMMNVTFKVKAGFT